VLGKSLPITFLVIFDTDCKIINSSVIQYREPYGGAVKNKNWNAQFKNKDSSSSYEVGKEINGISGATISVHSVSKGIHKLALLLPEIKDRL
jgi:Na+-translocating ferredoxin:NAD+ oxidoreductase RnfG subunit